jgi:hypothetical protein
MKGGHSGVDIWHSPGTRRTPRNQRDQTELVILHHNQRPSRVSMTRPLSHFSECTDLRRVHSVSTRPPTHALIVGISSLVEELQVVGDASRIRGPSPPYQDAVPHRINVLGFQTDDLHFFGFLYGCFQTEKGDVVQDQAGAVLGVYYDLGHFEAEGVGGVQLVCSRDHCVIRRCVAARKCYRLFLKNRFLDTLRRSEPQ